MKIVCIVLFILHEQYCLGHLDSRETATFMLFEQMIES